MVAAPTLNQGLVRFRHPQPDATQSDHDQWTERIVEAINQEGTAFFSSSLWKGQRVMRISVVNWRTNENDVRRTLEAIAKVIDSEKSKLLAELEKGGFI